MSPNLRRGVGAGVAILATAFLIAAADGGQVVSSSFDVPAQDLASGSATCTNGRAIASQGFAAPGFGTGNGEATPVRIASHRTGPHRLETAAFNFGSTDGTIRAYAYCSRVARGAEVVRDTVDVAAPLASAAAKPTCPAGTEAIAGGFAAPGFGPGGATVVAFTSKREGRRTWRVEAVNIPTDGGDTGKAGKLVGFAYCFADPPQVKRVAASADVGQDGLTRVAARCPDGTKAISGGFDGNVSFGAEISAAAAVASKRMGHAAGWTAKGLSAGSPTAKLTVYAYCVG